MAALIAAAPVFLSLSAVAQPNTTTRVSLTNAGLESDGHSYDEYISTTGRFVVFASTATNLIDGEFHFSQQIYLRDRQLNKTYLCSKDLAGNEGNDNSSRPYVTADGRYVTFTSLANNLVINDNNGWSDVFRKDMQTGQIIRVSVSTAGVEADNDCADGICSDDGRYVTFSSFATTLVSGDPMYQDVFLRDTQLNKTTKVSVSTAGTAGNGDSGRPKLTPDGHYVAFHSLAENLVTPDTVATREVFLRDLVGNTTERIAITFDNKESSGNATNPMCSANGRFVAFASSGTDLVTGDGNGARDVFVRDRQLKTTERVSLSTAGVEQDGDLFDSTVSISDDGRFVAFNSYAVNLGLVTDDNNAADVFVRDRQDSKTYHVSVSTAGAISNAASSHATISGNGQFACYVSSGDNLVANDKNGTQDAFVRELPATGRTVSGKILWNFLANGATPPTSVSIRINKDGSTIETRTVSVASNGDYSVANVPAGNLTLSFKQTHWLRKTMAANTTSGDVSNLNFDLTNGDATNDNAVDFFDLNAMLLNWGAAGSSDCDQDGAVGITDLNMGLLFFGSVGDA